MGLLVILPFAGLFGWCIWRIHRWLFYGDFGPDWRRRFAIHVVVGAALGAWFILFCAYNVAGMRIESFPIPTAIWSHEKPDDLAGPKVRHVLPTVIRIPAAITNLLCGMALCLAPLALAAFIKENKGQKDFAGPRGGLSG